MLVTLVVFWSVALGLAPDQPAPAAPSRPASASATAGAHVEDRGDSYYDFLLSRHLEARGDLDGAAAALRRAAEKDPRSAEVRAELASLFARQNRAEEAIRIANEAIAIDPSNAEAHWVLGSIYAARVQAVQEVGPGDGEDVDRAITHLEKARPQRDYDLGLLLTLGRLYLAKREHSKAAAVLRVLNQREPAVTEAGFLLAQALDGAGQRPDAIIALRETVAGEPRFFRAWMLLADLLEKEQRFEEAAAAYAQAARQAPRGDELRMRQASALLAAGSPAAARDVLEEVVRTSPTDVMALSLLSEAQRQTRDLEAAEATAKRAAALDPQGLRGAYALALVHEQRRDFESVVRTLTPALPPESDEAAGGSRMHIGALVRLGYAYQELGRYDDAVAAFQRARTLSPDDGLSDLYLAQAHIAARRYDDAVRIARAGGERQPEDSRFARLEAQALRESGQFDAAIALLRDRMARKPEVSVALSLATVLGQAKRWDEAQRVLDEAERTFTDDLDVPFQRGALYEQQDRHADAERAFRAVLERDPGHAPTLNYLGYMLAERGERLDEAVGLIQQALAEDPHNASYLDSLGWAWFKKKDLAKAREYLEPAARQLPRNSVVQDHWGDVLFALDDVAQAIAAWERALAGDGEDVDLAAIRRKIEDARKR